jgi:hypothetical protein
MLSLALAIAAILAAGGCTSAVGPAPTFALSARNAGDAPVRLKVLVASKGLPTHDLLIPARSGILSTASGAMDVTDGQAVPVVIEVYTDTCARLASVTIGEGRTRIVINPDLSLTTSADAAETGSGAVEPALVPAC